MSGTPGLEILGRDDCIRLLRTVTLGRIAYTREGLPACQPVIFRVNENHAHFRAVYGSSLAAGSTGSVVALQADDTHVSDVLSWTVTMVGNCKIVTDQTKIAELSSDPLMSTGPPATSTHFISIAIGAIEGWRRTTGTEPRPAAE